MMCLIEDCNNPKGPRKGLCTPHYNRQRAGKDMTVPLRTYVKNKGRVCYAPLCDTEPTRLGLCAKHYERMRNNGTLELEEFVAPGCAFVGCEKEHYALTYCNLHWNRIRRTGSVEILWRECPAEGCDRPVKGDNYCSMHYQRMYNNGDLSLHVSKGTAHYAWVGDEVTYRGLHLRLGREKGKAATYECAHCENPAEHWAYDYLDPAPLFNENDQVYSTNIDRYFPLCASCHVHFDSKSYVPSKHRREYRPGELPSFGAAHTRLQKLRGYAKEQQCADCENPAYDWSYNYNDEYEIFDSASHLVYSIDPSCYTARCRKCHSHFDRRR